MHRKSKGKAKKKWKKKNIKGGMYLKLNCKIEETLHINHLPGQATPSPLLSTASASHPPPCDFLPKTQHKESCNYENFINSADFLALRKWRKQWRWLKKGGTPRRFYGRLGQHCRGGTAAFDSVSVGISVCSCHFLCLIVAKLFHHTDMGQGRSA